MSKVLTVNNFVNGLSGNFSVNKIVFSYFGEIKLGFLTWLIETIESLVIDENLNPVFKKKIIHVVIESIQNIQMHAIDYTGSNNNSWILIYDMKTNFVLNFSSRLKNIKIENLKNSIDNINSISREQLNSYYIDVLRKNGMMENRGGGLGLIDIRRKSIGKIDYSFEPIDKESTYFSFMVSIEKQPRMK